MEDQASCQVVKRNSGRLECEWEFENFYEASLVNPGGVGFVDMHLCQLLVQSNGGRKLVRLIGGSCWGFGWWEGAPELP